MTFNLFRLALFLTYKCNAKCRHCFFNSGTERNEVMNLEMGLRIIDEAVNLGAEWASFTGGEPFLELKLLTEMVKYSSERGLKTEAVSNCYWASTPKEALRKLKSLKGKGLVVLNISLDDFHQEYVPIDYVRTAYNVAKSLGLKIIIMTTTKKNSRITSHTVPNLLNDEKIQNLKGKKILRPNALLIETQAIPIGRGKNLSDLEYSLITEVKCGEVLRDIGISPIGDVYPCCGALASRLNIGNVNDQDLESILKSASENKLLNAIRNGVSVSGAYTSKCHACLSLLN